VQRQPVIFFLNGLAAALGVLAAIAVWHGALRASGVVTLVLVSFFVAAACEPAVNRLERRGWRRGAAAGGILGTTILVIVVAGLLVGAGAASQAQDLRDSLPTLAAELERIALDTLGVTVNLDSVVERLEGFNVNKAVGDAAVKSLGVLVNVLAGLLVSFYLIVDGPRLRKGLCSMLPQRLQGEVLRIWDLAVDKTGGYLASKVILAGISALVHGAVFAIVGVPYAIPMALWVGVVSQVVPVIGTYLAIGLPVLLALADQQPGAAIAAVVLATVYQQVENNLLGPRLTAQAVQVHPAVGFVSVLVTVAAIGPAYTLLTIPVVATVQGFVAAYVKTHELIDDPRLEETTADGTERPHRLRRRRFGRDEEIGEQ
jgi:predicted PurR-regulated permease PerM